MKIKFDLMSCTAYSAISVSLGKEQIFYNLWGDLRIFALEFYCRAHYKLYSISMEKRRISSGSFSCESKTYHTANSILLLQIN